jgi:hypothetical protein
LKRASHDRFDARVAIADDYMASPDRGGQETDIGILK